MADMEGTGWIGADKLHLYFFPLPYSAPPVFRSATDHFIQNPVPATVGEKKVDKTRPRHLYSTTKPVAATQGCGDVFSDLPRGLFFLPGKGQGQVGGKVTMFLMPGDLQHNFREGSRMKIPVAVAELQGILDMLSQLFLHGHSIFLFGTFLFGLFSAPFAQLYILAKVGTMQGSVVPHRKSLGTDASPGTKGANLAGIIGHRTFSIL
jgi:hypothetical protein